MDKFWSIMAMPIGLFTCFTPAMVVWYLTDGRKRTPKDNEEHLK